MSKLLILSTQRSGSTMVCGDIAGTSLLGRPSEYFAPLIDSLSTFNKSGNDLLNEFNKCLVKGKPTDDGVQSVKVMSNQIGTIGKIIIDCGLVKSADSYKDAFSQYFSDWFILRVTRLDKVSQAVSRIIAYDTNVYHRVEKKGNLEDMLGKFSYNDRDESGLIYNAERIKAELEKINAEESFLNELIEKFSFIGFISIAYEDVVDDRGYLKELLDIFQFPYKDFMFKERSLKKVSGDVAKEWVQRYKNDK
jgi:LPS sulfotransferase NodH